jgi:hypothetical protein
MPFEFAFLRRAPGQQAGRGKILILPIKLFNVLTSTMDNEGDGEKGMMKAT